MMHKKGRKCVFISKKGKTNVKAIKKPYIRNRDSYKNEEKTQGSIKGHLNTINGVEVKKIKQYALQNKLDIKYLTT